jgi:hypothetical protein
MWINTKEFSPVALGKDVCNAHPLSLEHKAWTLEQLKRIKYGYTVGGQYITGDMYFWLNYYKVFDKNKKTYEYPKFLDFQAEFCKQVELARNPIDEKNKKGIVCVKRRQAGMSELMACIIVRELWFNQAPQIVMLADGDPQLLPLKKNTSNFINELNKGVFAKNLAVNRPDFKQLGYQLSGENVWRGQRGELLTRNFTKGQYEVTVGLTPTLMVYDEAGKAEGLIDAYESARPAITNMEGVMTGLPIIFGAVGDMEKSRDLKKMFYDPDTYNLMSYVVEGEKEKVGFFIEGWKMLVLDEDGNSDKEKGIEIINKNREKLKLGKDERALLKAISYSPIIPSEAFLDRGVNIFNTLKVQEHYDNLSKTNFFQELQYGEIEYVGQELDFIPTSNFSFEDDKKKLKKGRFLMYEKPEIIKGKVPNDMYIIGADPFHLDNGTSEGAIYVYKLMHEEAQLPCNKLVCEYLYRPSNPTLFADDVLKLCQYYNAIAMSEPSSSSVKDHFWQEGKLNYLAFTPRIVLTDLSKGSQVKYGFPINSATKSHGIGLVAKLIDDEIISIPFPRLLKEMIDYDSENNFDLIMALVQVLAYRSELWDKVKVRKEEQPNKPIPRYKRVYINGKPKLIKE